VLCSSQFYCIESRRDIVHIWSVICIFVRKRNEFECVWRPLRGVVVYVNILAGGAVRTRRCPRRRV